jgi:arylformamidase
MTTQRMIDYRGRRYTAEEFERQFNPRAVVPNVDAVQAKRAALSVEARGHLKSMLGLPYGDRPRETVDVFPAAGGANGKAPVQVFFHGGYWRAGEARANSFVAEPFVPAGACVMLVNYDLCPAVTVADIVAQTKRAIAWIHDHAGDWGGDPDRLYLSGHSAGAHLVAMALADDSGVAPLAAIKGATLISGVFDLEAVLNISVNAEIGLEPHEAAPLSPYAHAIRCTAPVIVAVGLGESEEWVEQSRRYAGFAREQGVAVETIEAPGADHYTILLDMLEPGNALAGAMRTQMGLRG